MIEDPLELRSRIGRNWLLAKLSRVGRSVARAAVAAGLVVIATTEISQAANELAGCDGFKWPIATEATLLQATGKPRIESGGPAPLIGKAFTLALVSFRDAHLLVPPERTPRMDPSEAGFVRFDAPTNTGSFEITISPAAWIDVLQDGHIIKASAFSGARDCPGARKSVRFQLAPRPFVVQVSGTTDTGLNILVEPTPH